MKIANPVKQFREAFTVVGRVVPTRSPKPILQSVKLVATEDGVTLLGTDLDIGIRHPIAGVQVSEPGVTLLPKGLVDKILKSADDDWVTIETDGENLKVRCGKAKWTFATDDHNLFPEPLSFDSSPAFTLAASDVKLLVNRTAYATDLDSTRYALGGMMIECDSGWVKFIATDGRRLASQSVAGVIGAWNVAIKPVIPKRFGLMLAGLSKDDAAEVDFAFTPQYVIARVGGTILGSRLVEGRFPRYQDVFPADADTVKIRGVNAASFGSALEQAAATTSDESRGVDLEFAAGVARLSSRAADVGSAEVEFDIAHDGPAVGFTSDPRCLTDALASFGDESFDFGIVDHKNAVVIRTDTGFEGVVMPLTRDR